jgi:hypothetical protein
MTVVVHQVLAQQQGQVSFTADQGPIQELTAEGSNDTLADQCLDRLPGAGPPRTPGVVADGPSSPLVGGVPSDPATILRWHRSACGARKPRSGR